MKGGTFHALEPYCSIFIRGRFIGHPLQKKCVSATHNCNALCVAEIICNALCVADFAMQKTGLQIFCNASQRCVAVICNALLVADEEVRPTLWWNYATHTALRNFSATIKIALQNISASDVHKQ